MRELLETLDRLQPRRVLVLGDLILDRYTWGAAERVSPEAPTVVLRVDQVDVRLGGAAAVAGLLRGLGAEVLLAGVVGDDASGRAVERLLSDSGVDARLVVADSTRPTTVKERFMGRAPHRTPHQILRVDHESTQALADDVAGELADRVASAVTQCSALIVSDYAKGTCGTAVLARAIAAARQAGIPIVIDPARGADYARYRGATVIKPNRVEAEAATGQAIATPQAATQAGKLIQAATEAQAVVVTLDQDGMILVGSAGPAQEFPTAAQEVTDITGAGDTVVAVLGLALANACPLEVAAPLANAAAGWQVRRVGIATLSLDDLRGELIQRASPSKVASLQELLEAVREHRRRGRRIALTNGCFDLLHVGHVTYLQAARRQGDILIVAINSDRSVRGIKGPQRPVIAQHDRAAMLAALACVDHVLIFDEPTPHALLAALQPDVLVKGGDYALDQVVGREVVEAYGGEVCVTGHVPGISTSQLLQRLGERGDRDAATVSEFKLAGSPRE